MTPSFRMLLCASAATFLHAAVARAAEVTATPGTLVPGIASAPVNKGDGPAVAKSSGPAVTAAQGAAAEASLRDWLGGLLGPTVKLPEQAIQFTPAGDHFDVVIPVIKRDAASGGDVQILMTAQPLDGGKWDIEKMRFTNPLNYTLDLPMPPADDSTGPMVRKPVTFTGTFEGQDGSILLDPSLRTPTTWTSTQTGVVVHAAGPVTQDTKVAAANSVSTIKPAGEGRVDVATEGTIQSYALTSQTPGAPLVEVAINLVRVNFGMTGLSQAKAAVITRNLVGIMTAALAATPTAGAPGAPGAAGTAVTPPAVGPEVIHALLDALQDVASGMTMTEAFEEIAVKVGGIGGTLGKFGIGLDAKSDGGLLQAHMDLSAEELELPDLPLGGMEALIPESVALRPFVSGIGVAELMRIANAASDQHDPAPADIMALFSHGGITTGLESMSLDIAGASFTGMGKVVITAPDPSAITGTAQITAENFDALMQKVAAIPALQQGVAVLVFAKGIGRTVNDKIVWDVSYKDGKVLVNNVDLTAMAGGGAPAPAPDAAPQGPAKRPAPRPTAPRQR